MALPVSSFYEGIFSSKVINCAVICGCNKRNIYNKRNIKKELLFLCAYLFSLVEHAEYIPGSLKIF